MEQKRGISLRFCFFIKFFIKLVGKRIFTLYSYIAAIKFINATYPCNHNRITVGFDWYEAR